MRSARVVALAALAAFAAPAVAHAAPPPLDSQDWSWQDNLTWSDYHPLPGPDYSDPSIQPSVKQWKVALVVTDFPDKTFTLSQPVGGTPFGTPTDEAHDIPRDQVPAFLRDFLNKPQALNHNQTMNRYWMEDTHGKYGVQLDAYGPYQLPGRSYQYFMSDFSAAQNRAAHCPDAAHFPCTRDFRTDVKAAWTAAVGADVVNSYDNAFYISAGEDESSTWQEFGQMKWLTQDDVPDEFGPKQYGDATQTNWAITRYVPWSSWASVSTIWPNAVTSGAKPLTSIEGESSGLGTFTHELTHNLGILDNYSNPYATPYQRGFTGMWDMMSRGSFNGPGGPHTRFLIPATQGGSLGSQHNLRNKLKLGFVSNDQVLRLNRSGLTKDGIAVADVTAREVDPGSGLSGVSIALDGSGDLEPACSYTTNWQCDGGKYTGYTAEVVQQIGSDSFDPGHGVILSKTKTTESQSCGSASCFVWVVDSHPNDINHVDYVGPDGTPVMATLGDERQLNDASFNAGLGSGSSYEYEDTANRLHFYIIDLHKGADGVLHYKIGVQSLDGAGPQGRGVALADAPGIADDGGLPACNFTLKNTGTAATLNPADNPSANAASFMNTDVYRLSASATGTGWTAHLRNALATADFGAATTVPVYVDRGADASAGGTVTLTATSVSDPSKTATAVCGVSTGDVGGAVPATLALTMGAPAQFGAFTPGLAKQYTASTTATVVSTAGDATLTVADTSATAPGHLVNGSFTLPQPLQAGGQTLPATLKSYDAPTSNDDVPITFQQSISETDALRTGTYAKTLTFTLSTTNP